MASEIFDPSVSQTILDAQKAARQGRTKPVTVSGALKTIPSPFPSPADWRDTWIYFLLLDRFNNPGGLPTGTWNMRFDHRQGGTLSGARAQLGYLQQLGVKAVWLSPVLKNAKPDRAFNYHGYGQQDFLNLDARLASDGTLATAERELVELVDGAHARGMYVILDIVLNHSARVFDYLRPNGVVSSFADPAVMNAPAGTEPPVEWLNGFGAPRPDWKNQLPAPSQLGPDDAVWPSDLQNHVFFRRRGSKLTDDPGGRFVRGDFGDMRQLVVEYDARVAGQEALRSRYGISPVLGILIRAYSYLMARYDLDGYRLDTVKYVDADAIEVFGNAMREFALTIGKRNFFTFGEVYDREDVVARFIGRNGSGDGFGIDAALDFPLFFTLPGVAKRQIDVSEIRRVFQDRKKQEAELLSSHGEAGRFFVSFLDNHDQHERIQHPATPPEQVSLALVLMFTLQGIPSIYYGTEQGLSGTVDANGAADLGANESTREALWGKPNAFDTSAAMFRQIRRLSDLRDNEPALRYGRFYFREVGTQGDHFGHSFGNGGVVAFSRIVADREVLVIANTGAQSFTGSVILDRDLNATPRQMTIAHSNLQTSGTRAVRHIAAAMFDGDGGTTSGPAAALDVALQPSEAQVWTPVP